MANTSKKKETKKEKFLGNPVPVRLDADNEKLLNALNTNSGVPKAVIIRACLDLILPQVIAGEINLFEKKAA